MLCDAFGDRGLSHRVVDFSSGRMRGDGEVSWHRLRSLVRPLGAAFGLIVRQPGTLYLTNSQSWTGFLKDAVFILSARAGGHRIVLHLKGGNYDNFYREQSRARQFLIRRTLTLADRLVVLGTALTEMYAFVPGYREKVVVVVNGLPDDMPGWNRVRAAKSRTGDQIRVLYLSNLIESKGYLDVLEAVRRLVRDHGLNLRADFCGGFRIMSDTKTYRSIEEARADFMDRIEACGLSDRVTWHGSVSGERKRELLARAHYFALPTAYKYEGQPVSIIEAMAYGALVISTRYRTIPEMLDEGRAGVFVEPGRPDQIVDAVLSHPVGSASYSALIEAARARCAEKFSKKSHLDALIAVITSHRADHRK